MPSRIRAELTAFLLGVACRLLLLLLLLPSYRNVRKGESDPSRIRILYGNISSPPVLFLLPGEGLETVGGSWKSLLEDG